MDVDDVTIGGERGFGEHDFVAALPKRLLAHPRGPIAYAGHRDTAWRHGFADAPAWTRGHYVPSGPARVPLNLRPVGLLSIRLR